MSKYLVLKDFNTALRRFKVGEERHEQEFEGDVLDIDERVEGEFLEPVLEIDPDHAGHAEGAMSRRHRAVRRSAAHDEAAAEQLKEPDAS